MRGGEREHFKLGSQFIFQDMMIIVLSLCFSFKIYLAQGCFCCVFAVLHFLTSPLKVKLSDSFSDR